MEIWKTMPFWGMWNWLDIIDDNIFYYLMSKNPQENHLNKPLSESLNLNFKIIL
jgi:hypothetical protein